MSREWTLHCKSCDTLAPEDFNHGEDLLRTIVHVYPHVKAAYEADTHGYFSVNIAGRGPISSELSSWLSEHVEHDLELQDEHGSVEPLEEKP